jgi:sigma54-dependent transcription regulator
MDTLNEQTWFILAGVVAGVLIALAAWYVYGKQQSRRLQKRFGPVYDRTVQDLRNQTTAETELKAREKRVERLAIVPLHLPALRERREDIPLLAKHFIKKYCEREEMAPAFSQWSRGTTP